MTTQIARHRANAFATQQGRCFYCNAKMWLENVDTFAQEHGISLRQAQRLRCTAEHLLARKDGGTDTAANIVAACYHCNKTRHAGSNPPTPERYRGRVQLAMSKARWHGKWLFQKHIGAEMFTR
jgi:5-methylcytosine-specific restriction endonuclease McrA